MSQKPGKQHAGAGGLGYAPGPERIDLPCDPITEDTTSFVERNIDDDRPDTDFPRDMSTDQIGGAIMPGADWSPMQHDEPASQPAPSVPLEQQMKSAEDRESEREKLLERRRMLHEQVAELALDDALTSEHLLYWGKELAEITMGLISLND